MGKGREYKCPQILLNGRAWGRVLIHVQAMHEGVIRDMEQQRIKRERQLDFDMQRELEAEYKKEQTVRDTTAAGDIKKPG